MRELFIALLLTSAMSAAHAALFDRGNGMIYDDALDITWLQNANQGAGSAFDNGTSLTDGLMTWANAVAWVDSLQFGGFDDWRLPLMDVNLDHTIADCAGIAGPAATEMECRDNELGYMYYHNLMGSFGIGLTGDQALFTSIQNDYWSGTEDLLDPGRALSFLFASGGSSNDPKTFRNGAWAVRDGDVGAVVPIPAAIWLFGSALAGLGLARRRK